jgi:excisionase family DNA binding protein
MTLAEVADELRVNPATVRMWVSKGRLKASRAGMRKWIVRRSDLEDMLAATNPGGIDLHESSVAAEKLPPRRNDPDVRSEPDASAPRFVTSEAVRENAAKLVQYTAKALDDALDASRYAPPSPGYLDRLRGIADAFEQFSVAILDASRAGAMRWSGRTVFHTEYLPYELQPGRNRPRGEGLWDEFDAAVQTLSIATTGNDMPTVVDAFREAGETLRAVADELEHDESWRAGYGAS